MKNFNLIRNLEDEIAKGNVYLDKKSNTVSADALTKRIMSDYKKYLESSEADLNKSFNDFKIEKLSEYTRTLDVIVALKMTFNFVYERDIRSAKPDEDAAENKDVKGDAENAVSDGDSGKTVSDQKDSAKGNKRKQTKGV